MRLKKKRTAIGAVIALTVVLLIMISAFVWLVIRFDPLTDDFVDGSDPVPTQTTPFEGD